MDLFGLGILSILGVTPNFALSELTPLDTQISVHTGDALEQKSAVIESCNLRQSPQNEVISNNKISGSLSMQVDLRKKQIADPKPERLEQMRALGMRVDPIGIQRLYIYFSQKPTPAQVKELQKMDIELYLNSWIPPVGNHPAGFLTADMPFDKLEELAGKKYVIRLDTAEQVGQPFIKPGKR